MNETAAIDNSWGPYALAAANTAVYPNRGENLAYAALGLAGETAELLGAASDERNAEAGDVCWYIAAVCHEAGIDPAELDDCPVLHATGEAERELVTAVGRIAESAKKAIRDDGGQVSEQRRERIRESLLAATAALAQLICANGSSLDDVRDGNIAKLTGRQQNGTLHGDGDHR